MDTVSSANGNDPRGDVRVCLVECRVTESRSVSIFKGLEVVNMVFFVGKSFCDGSRIIFCFVLNLYKLLFLIKIFYILIALNYV